MYQFELSYLNETLNKNVQRLFNGHLFVYLFVYFIERSIINIQTDKLNINYNDLFFFLFQFELIIIVIIKH